jgi:hypothetical protein
VQWDEESRKPFGSPLLLSDFVDRFAKPSSGDDASWCDYLTSPRAKQVELRDPVSKTVIVRIIRQALPQTDAVVAGTRRFENAVRRQAALSALLEASDVRLLLLLSSGGNTGQIEKHLSSSQRMSLS